MFKQSATVRLLRIARSIERQAVQVQEMAPGAFWASCGLCHAHGPGISRKDASQKLAHSATCSLLLVRQTRVELSRAAA